MKKIIILTIMIQFFLSCNKESSQKDNILEDEVTTGSYYMKDFLDEEKKMGLSTKILKEGDTLSYKELKEIYFLSNYTKEFLSYSMVMSHDYNYDLAYFDTYLILRNFATSNENIRTNKLADYYLLKAYELSPKKMNSAMKERFGKNLPKIKAEDYWKLINR